MSKDPDYSQATRQCWWTSLREYTLWTNLSAAAWDELQSRGVLQAPWARSEIDFRPAYLWMAAQMRQRLGPPPRPGICPLWAWLQIDTPKPRQRRPDLRERGHIPAGSQGFRVEFVVPAEQVLLSDFQLWHHVLNHFHLPRDEAEDLAFEEEFGDLHLSWQEPEPLDPLQKKARRRIRRSWDHIFELEQHQHPAQQIQACLWQVEAAQVREVTSFRGR